MWNYPHASPAIAAPRQVPWIGHYLDNGPQAADTVAPVEAVEYATLIFVPEWMTFDRFCHFQTADGGAGSVTRCVVRRFDPGTPAVPGAVQLDAGTVASDTGGDAMKLVTISLTLTAGLWWLSLIRQGGAGAGLTWHTVTVPDVRVPMTGADTSGRHGQGVSQTGITGAAPNTFTSPATVLDGDLPWVALRRSG